MTQVRIHPLYAFVGFALAANIAIAVMVRHEPRPAVTLAACVDLLVSIPAVYYWLMVRPRLQAPVTLIPIVLGGLLRASYLVPASGLLKMCVAVGCELGIAYFLVRRGRNSRVARLLGWEFSILALALGSWGRRPDVARGGIAFTMHRESGVAVLFSFLAGLSVIEAAGVHLIVLRWSHAATWALTAISIYGALLLVALARSFALYPIVVTPNSILIRAGLLWRVEITRANIARVRRANAPIPRKRDADYLAVTAMADPNVMIELNGPVVAEGLYGRTKLVRRIGISADQASDLISAI